MPSAAPETLLTIEEWLATWLGSKTQGDLGGRVYPVFLPDNIPLPAAVYRRQRTAREKHSRGATGLATATFEIAVLAQSDRKGFDTVTRVAQTIRLNMDGLQGDTQRGQHVRMVSLDDESDDIEQPAFGDAVVIFKRVLTLTIAYLEQTRALIGGA